VCRLDTCWGVAKGVLRGLGLGKDVKEVDNRLKAYAPRTDNHEKVISEYKKWSECKSRFSNW
jgi:hypothetical protein